MHCMASHLEEPTVTTDPQLAVLVPTHNDTEHCYDGGQLLN